GHGRPSWGERLAEQVRVSSCGRGALTPPAPMCVEWVREIEDVSRFACVVRRETVHVRRETCVEDEDVRRLRRRGCLTRTLCEDVDDRSGLVSSMARMLGTTVASLRIASDSCSRMACSSA